MSDTKPSAPTAWERVLSDKGWTQEKLAEEAGVSKATVNRMVRGQGRPNSESVRKVAAVLTDGDRDAVWKLVGTGHFDYGDFPIDSIADELRLLTPDERKSVIAVVRSMSDPRGKRLSDAAPAAQKKLEAVPDIVWPQDASGPEPQMTDAEAAQTESGPSEGQMRRDQQNKDAENDSN